MNAPPPALCIIVPVLDERSGIEASLASWREAAARSDRPCEIVVVDGGSDDGTREWLMRQSGIEFRRSPRGRARQMNAGAAEAKAPWLLFLHADAHPDPALIADLMPRLDAWEGRLARDSSAAFSFHLRFRNPDPAYRTMELGVAWRCEHLGLPYGDQGLCIRRELFEAMGGFREDAPMEDLDFVLRLREHGGIVMLPQAVEVSARHYERHGPAIGTLYNVGRLAGGVVAHYLGGERRARQA